MIGQGSMSYYNSICQTCPDKKFIEPGTEMSTKPRHAGDDGAQLDATHEAVPMAVRSDEAQRKMLDRALAIIREQAPAAVSVDLETTDQDDYGFVLAGLKDADGNDLLPAWDDTEHPLAGLNDAVVDEINDLEWDGVVGEDDGGYATIALGAPAADAPAERPLLPADLLWHPANNGSNKMRWFVMRSEKVPLPIRYHERSDGQLRRYGSHEAALKVAEKLNAAEAARFDEVLKTAQLAAAPKRLAGRNA